MRGGLILLATLLLSGCGEDEESALRGSLQSVCDLEHDTIRARLYSSSLTIEYVTGPTVKIRLTVSTKGEPIEGPGTYELGDRGEVSGACEAPPLVSGSLTLDEYKPTDGARIKGRWSAILDGVHGQLSVVGEFETLLELNR